MIQRVRKQYDARSVAKNLEKVNAELVDVQRIMVRNIDEVLQRGNLVSGWVCCSFLVFFYLI